MSAPYGQATTSTGIWLDMLSSTLDSPPHSPRAEGPSTIVYAVNNLSGTPAAVALADLVAEHDPEHRGIDLIGGTPGHAILMAALMRRRLSGSVEAAISVIEVEPCNSSGDAETVAHVISAGSGCTHFPADITADQAPLDCQNFARLGGGALRIEGNPSG